jgi:hypothetical protein
MRAAGGCASYWRKSAHSRSGFCSIHGSGRPAVLSLLFRAPAFLISTLRHGLETMATTGIVPPSSRYSRQGSIGTACERALPVGRKADSIATDLARMPMCCSDALG